MPRGPGSRASRSARAAILVVAFALLPAAAADAAPYIGIADQKASMFDDRRLLGLGLRHARVYVPYDVLQDPNTLPLADEWFAKARTARMQPMITIDRSRRPGRQSRNPTTTEIRRAVRGWRARWPGQVKRLSTWNEGNINKRPELVASWYLAARRACPGCLVLGADLVDRSNAITWAQRLILAAGETPKGWGVHAYNDANTFSTAAIEAILVGLPGQIHLTETGGVVTRTNPTYRFSGCGTTHAADATRHLLETIGGLSPRIRSIYLYHWSSASRVQTFDSAFIGPSGQVRPALNVLRRHLGLAAPPPARTVEASPCNSGRSRPLQRAPKLAFMTP